MTISEVLATAQTIDQDTNDVALGTMGGHGISVGSGKRNSFFAEEHGIIMTIMNVQPKTAYFQGLHRQHQRFDRLDYAWPSFANIGEQEVYVKEIRNEAGAQVDVDAVFGYIPRYSEYKFINSQIAGEMRDTQNYWHLARTWGAADIPALNEEFIECVPDKRIFAVTDPDTHTIYAHIFNNIHAVRKLPRFGIPTI